MISFLIAGLVYGLSVLLAAKVVPGLRVRSFGSAVIFALVLGVLDTLLFKLLALMTLPLVILSLGLFLVVIRAGLFWLADQLVDGVEVDGFGAALLGSLMSGVINFGLRWVLHLG